MVQVADGLERGHEGQRLHQHFRARLHGGLHGKMQGGGAGVGGDDVLRGHAEKGGDVLFEALHFVAHAEVAVLKDDAAYGVGFGLAHDGPGKTQGGGGHGVSLWCWRGRGSAATDVVDGKSGVGPVAAAYQRYGMSGASFGARSLSVGSCGMSAQLQISAGVSLTALNPYHTSGGMRSSR